MLHDVLWYQIIRSIWFLWARHGTNH